MVVRPRPTSPLASLALRLFCLFCCTLVAALAAQATSAAPSPALEEICRQPEMEKALANYWQLAMQGGWPRVPGGPALHENDSNERILFLRQRLVVSVDLPAPAGQTDRFDGLVREAVQRFQSRHGLTADGVVGAKTLTELNVPISERIRQLAASLKYCRSLPPLPEKRHILVNIPDFTLKLFEDDKLLLSMPVIVGTTSRQTPVFNGFISFLVLNPSWEVPHSIATQDLLPKIKGDPGFLEHFHLRVFRGRKVDEEIDPAAIDWAGLSPGYFPYRLRQDPGPANALGRVKFYFSNPYDLYLHDTPAQGLFKKASRPFSSGCIRLARPLDLAVSLLQGTPLSSMDTLTAAISGKKTQSIALPSPIALHIVYTTAWVDGTGIVQFRRDIYNRNPTQ